ncbi:hypothetical protein CUMW_204190 [Citrus unshiu]|uniref:Protein kinase domain-containing protein n=1 Tax=Citrus unshiu TaxID=55188 RepID=A0A2H5Q7W0_CITUN|nr:hypothetical protein CUMW_204190 [Citrus unshiu]
MDFGFNKLVGVVPTTIFNVSTLKMLCLHSNSLSGRLPLSADVQLPNLEELYLWGNNFNGTIPNFIFNASKLSILDLEINSFSGFIPNTFGNLRNLKWLGLNDNYLTSSTPELSFLSSLSNCKYLKYFSFSDNPLDGILPRAIGNLSQSMENFDMENCNISGSIPEEISNLTNLIAIYLGGNKLNGTIPITLDNQLEGSIPDDLCRLAALFQLDLGLEGEIPREGPFRNFSAKSFKGNELLCGMPNLQVPPCRTRIHHKSRKNDLLIGIVLPLSTIFMMVVILLILKYRKGGKSQLNDANMPSVANHRRFTYLELFQATNEFSEKNLIGRGGFGFVYKARIQDGMEVAVKFFDLQYRGAIKSFDIECGTMKRIRHRNLIKIIGSCSNDDFKALVLEYMPHGSLEKCLYSSNYTLDIFQRLNIMIDVASALEYLHFGYSVPIIHCDLKPSNV